MSVTVTYLEMRRADELLPKHSADGAFQIAEARVKQWQVNKFFYGFVGEPWSWLEKSDWSDEQWRFYADDNRLRTWIASYEGSPAGYFELKWDDEDGVEINYMGLSRAFIGRGLGGPLLTAALTAAWDASPRRVWVHTCTLDHPASLNNYLARGMKIYQTKLEKDPGRKV